MTGIHVGFMIIALWFVPLTGPLTSLVPVLPSPPEPSQKTSRPILYNWVPSGTSMADIRDLNAKSYVMVYSSVLPDKGTSGIIDTPSVIRALEKKIPNSFSGWGLLDFEGEIFNRLFHEPMHTKFNLTTGSLIKTMRAVKKKWPRAKWTYWGMPDVKFWIHAQGDKPANWATANESQKEAALKRSAAGFKAIAEEVDWISPWIYDMYQNELFTKPHQRENMNLAQQKWAMAKCSLAREISESRSRGPIPVIPMFRLMFAPGGNVTDKIFVSETEFRTDVLEPVVKAGVDGLSTWNGLEFHVISAFRKAINPHQVGIRDKARTVLKQLLDIDNDFDWNSPRAPDRIHARVRPLVMNQLRMMRTELDEFKRMKPIHEPTNTSISESIRSEMTD